MQKNWMALAAISVMPLFAACGGGSSSDGSAPGSAAANLAATPGTVTFTAPSDGGIGVPTNTTVVALFSEGKDGSSITPATFRLEGLTGSVSYDAQTRTAQLTPAGVLAPNTKYTAVISQGVRDLSGRPLAADYTWSFSTGAGPDTRAPTVVSVNPVNGASGAATNGAVSVTFSEVMIPTTLSGLTVTLGDGSSNPVDGTVTFTGRTGTFTPSQDLLPNTAYNVTVTPGAQDLAGNPVGEVTLTFTTGPGSDQTGPRVAGSAPAAGATNVPINRAILVAFTEPVDPLSVTTETLTVRQGSLFVAGTVAYVGTVTLFFPREALPSNAALTVTVARGLRDLAGNGLSEDIIWGFATGSEADTTPSTLVSASPANGETGVALTETIRVTFGEDMNPFIFGAIDGIPAAINYDFATKTFSLAPTSPLQTNSQYTNRIAAADLAGNVTVFEWKFTTGTGG